MVAIIVLWHGVHTASIHMSTMGTEKLPSAITNTRSKPGTMQAIVQHSYGMPEVLQLSGSALGPTSLTTRSLPPAAHAAGLTVGRGIS